MGDEYAQIIMKAPVENVGTLSDFKKVVNAPMTDFEQAFQRIQNSNQEVSSNVHLKRIFNTKKAVN